jgi:nicotinamide phosphoribosyltransferase
MTYNLILNTDSYKASHYLQYPPDTQYLSSYIESRGGRFGQLIFFGLQAFLKKYLQQPIKKADIDEAEEFFGAHGLPFNRQGWEYILDNYDGFLPLRIEAVREGSCVPVHQVLVQVINTDPKCYWLPTYIETALLRAVWYPTTVATISWQCKKIIKEFLLKTADDISSLPFKLHDFGARGCSCYETSALGGAAHLVNFKGSDTIAGILAAKKYYHESMAAFSIPAAEHSTITTWGKDGEASAYAHMLDTFGGPNHIVAVVSDSYDIWNAIENIWGKTLKEKVITHGGTLVIRPDSGEPISMIISTIQRLMNRFGFSTNHKGFRVLPNFLRVIHGDRITPENMRPILETMTSQGLSTENITFAMGAELLQKLNRDTLQFAMKVSAAEVNGEWRDVYKDPITDQSKKSKHGRLALVIENGVHKTIRQVELSSKTNLLETVFENGKLLRDSTFSEIRERADQAMQ